MSALVMGWPMASEASYRRTDTTEPLAVLSIDFMDEKGHRFFGARPVAINPAAATRRNQAAQRIQALVRGTASRRRGRYQHLPVEIRPGHRFVKSTLNLQKYLHWSYTGVLRSRGLDMVGGVVLRVDAARFSGWFSCLEQHGDGTRRQTVVSRRR